MLRNEDETSRPTRSSARAELRTWYLAGLRPKLVRAASDGVVSDGAAGALDALLRALLDAPPGRAA
ncbi:MAG TPA: hypothetical protein VFA30_11060 [Gaiellaceae bacterium]|nr:hypothetical protein [Gaiellaceae bacterium]